MSRLQQNLNHYNVCIFTEGYFLANVNSCCFFFPNKLSVTKENIALGTSGKEPPANAGDLRDAGLISGSGRSSGGGYGNLLQYSCLENLMDRGA